MGAPRNSPAKTENSSDLAHYFKGAQFDELKKITKKNNEKYPVAGAPFHPRTEKAQYVLECHNGLRGPIPCRRGSLQAGKSVLKF